MDTCNFIKPHTENVFDVTKLKVGELVKLKINSNGYDINPALNSITDINSKGNEGLFFINDVSGAKLVLSNGKNTLTFEPDMFMLPYADQGQEKPYYELDIVNVSF